MAVKLSENAITMITSGAWQSKDVKPVLQVYEIKPISLSATSGAERYRMLLSDGSAIIQAMLGTQNNELVKSQQLQNGSVIQLKEFSTSLVKNRTIIITVVDLAVVIVNCDVVGDPKPFTRMQPINQPATSIASPQTDTGGSLTGSVPQPNTVNSSIYSPQQGPSAGLHSRTESVTAMSRPPVNSYMRSVQPIHDQPPPMYMNRGPVAKNEAPPKTIPIAALNPYQGRWTIKARVSAKSELRRYNNAKGDGKVFSFDLLDSDGGEIRTTCFNAVADQFYDQIEVGKVYFLSKGSVKPAQKAFNHLKNDHEIMLDSTSTIQPCSDDDSSIPHQQFHFCSIADIEGLNNNSVLDIIGVVSSIKPSSSIQRKNGTETLKRTLTLRDMTGRSVEVTLWGNFCSAEGQTLQNMCDSGEFPVLAMKSARVGEFNGKSLGTISMSQLCIEPDFPEAHKLRQWFESVGRNTPFVSLSQETNARSDVRKTISQIKDEKLGTSEKPDWITVSATIAFMRSESFSYTACPLIRNERQCSKKVTNNGDGKWQCDTCDQTVDQCDYRYVLQLQIQDHTGITWVTAFQEGGEEIMGISAKELYNIRHEEQDEDKFTEIVRNVQYTKFNFKLKVKEEMFGDDPRVKVTVLKAEKIKFSSDMSFLLDLLKKDVPTSVVPKIENPIGFKESASYMNHTGSVASDAQQAALPANQMGHYGNQYGGSRLGSTCNSCGGVDHNSTNCPSVVNASGGRVNSMPSGGGNSGASGDCYKCHLPGHWARDCPGVNGVPSAYGNQYGGSRLGSTCNSCGGVDHNSTNCPSVVNASGGRFNSMPSGGGNSGASGDCYKCHQPGHWARDCPGVNGVPSAYASSRGNVPSGRYGGASGQYVGGY